MNAGQNSVRRLVNGKAPSRDSICTTCLHRLTHQTRRYAAAAVAEQPQDEPPPPQHIAPVTSTQPRKAHTVLTSPVLSRPPLLTRSLTSFEKAYYLYQKRLNERLALPFPRYFYYQKGTPADKEWKRKRAVRKTAARDIGIYEGYGEVAWNDEVLVGDRTADEQAVIEALIRDAEGKVPVGKDGKSAEEGDGSAEAGAVNVTGEVQQQKLAIQRPLPRVTEADEKGDLTSLNRKLDRSLYLLIRKKDGRWRFPEDRVYGRENLHQAAERILIQTLGINMNTWIIGNHPVGHHARNYPTPRLNTISPNTLVSTSTSIAPFQQEEYGEKVFFMKGRIMAGQADISRNEYGDQEFQWLAKEEVMERVEPGYWKSVRGMLVER